MKTQNNTLPIPVLEVNTDLTAFVQSSLGQVDIKELNVSLLQAPHADNNHVAICAAELETMSGQRFSDIAMASGDALITSAFLTPVAQASCFCKLAVLENYFALASAQSSSPLENIPVSGLQASSESGPIFDVASQEMSPAEWPANPKSGGGTKPASEKQFQYLNGLGESHGVDVEKLAVDTFGIPLEELQGKQADMLIRHLQKP